MYSISDNADTPNRFTAVSNRACIFHPRN